MPYTLILHIQNEESVVGEVEELPKPTDLIVTLNNPRRMDGKDVHYISDSVVTVIFPISRLTFIELLPTKEEEGIFGFVRE
jgi:hypothetical protein